MNAATVARRRRAATVLAAAGICALLFAGCTGARSAQGSAPSLVTSTAVATRADVPRLPEGVTPAMITLGDSVFHANACARCHGRGGLNGPNGPPLVKANAAGWLHGSGSYDDIVATIVAGVPREKLKDQTRRFEMNPRGSFPPINDEQVRAVAAYIWKLNHP